MATRDRIAMQDVPRNTGARDTVEWAMDLSICEAAPLLGRSERAVRARIARGELPARRHGRTWRIPLATLPLTDAQRESLQHRSDAARRALDAVLPSAAAKDRRHAQRSVADLLPFARGVDLLRDLQRLEPGNQALGPCCERLRRALAEIAAGAVEYGPDHRVAALRSARADLGRVVGLLWCAAATDAALADLARRLEHDVIPPLGGLLRQTERRQRA